MDKIRVLEGFIEQKDIDEAISLIDNLVATDGEGAIVGKSEDPQSSIQNFRQVFTDPDYPEVARIVKKYHAKLKDIEPEYADTYPHSVILVRYDLGGELELHNDFENYSPCSRCTHANAMYLNDNFEGGDIYFPNIGLSLHPSAGTVVYFPQTNFKEDHPDMLHGVTALTSGTKYFINFCVTTDPDKIVPLLK